jgi:hypothetical protein
VKALPIGMAAALAVAALHGKIVKTLHGVLL